MFLISSGMLLVCGTLYVLFAESNLQPWNDSDKDKQNEKELEFLNAKNKDSIVKKMGT